MSNSAEKNEIVVYQPNGSVRLEVMLGIAQDKRYGIMRDISGFSRFRLEGRQGGGP